MALLIFYLVDFFFTFYNVIIYRKNLMYIHKRQRNEEYNNSGRMKQFVHKFERNLLPCTCA